MLIYAKTSYRDIIQHFIDGNASVKGYKSSLAKAGGFQLSYLSQVLNGHNELTLDQAAALSEFFGLEEEETQYFLVLVGHARATHETLKKILTKRIETIRAKRALGVWGDFVNSELSLLNTLKVASHWEYIAVWAALDLELEGNSERIAAYLKLSRVDVENALKELQEMNLVKCVDGVWQGRPEKSISLYGNREVSKILIQTHINKHLSDFDKVGNHDRTIFHPVSEETLRKVDTIAKRCYKEIHKSIVNCTKKKDRLVGFHYSLFKV